MGRDAKPAPGQPHCHQFQFFPAQTGCDIHIEAHERQNGMHCKRSTCNCLRRRSHDTRRNGGGNYLECRGSHDLPLITANFVSAVMMAVDHAVNTRWRKSAAQVVFCSNRINRATPSVAKVAPHAMTTEIATKVLLAKDFMRVSLCVMV